MVAHNLLAKFPSITTRPLLTDADFWRVHQLLIDCYTTTPLGFTWDIRRWEGKRFYAEQPTWPPPQCQLWETVDGRLVGVVHPEGGGEVHLQVHPDFRHMEPALVAWAEEHLVKEIESGLQRQLSLFVYDYDTARQQLLLIRGFTKQHNGGVIRRYHFGTAAPIRPQLAAGYTLRTTQPTELTDCQRIADLLNAAFNRNFHSAVEYQTFTKLAPSFRPDLDLVAVAPSGEFAAYVGIPYDATNCHGIFEPVCTHPAHRQKGLAKALMQEGLCRLHALGATTVTVDTGDMVPANRLYDSIDFSEVCKGHFWCKVFGE